MTVAITTLLVAVGPVGVVPAPSAVAKPIEENFSITVGGAFGDVAFTPDNASISVNQSNQIDQQVLQIRVSASDGEYMSFDFSTPAGSKQNFDVGYHGYAQRYPFMDPGRPGQGRLSLHLRRRGCRLLRRRWAGRSSNH